MCKCVCVLIVFTLVHWSSVYWTDRINEGVNEFKLALHLQSLQDDADNETNHDLDDSSASVNTHCRVLPLIAMGKGHLLHFCGTTTSPN